MKKIKNNNKGFTLIELLAVIVILAILVIIAIPAVTKYLNSARQGTFSDNAHAAISAVRNEVISKGFTADGTTTPSVMTFEKDKINNLLEKKLNSSPFGSAYTKASIKVTQTTKNNNTTYTYEMCLIDEGGHGFEYIAENSIDDNAVNLSGQSDC
mgnify:CR=1 FL=1